MMLPVRAYPLLVMEDRADDVHCSRLEPLAVVAFLKFHLISFVPDYMKPPGLLVHRRGGKPDTLHAVVQLFLFNTRRLKAPTAISRFY